MYTTQTKSSYSRYDRYSTIDNSNLAKGKSNMSKSHTLFGGTKKNETKCRSVKPASAAASQRANTLNASFCSDKSNGHVRNSSADQLRVDMTGVSYRKLLEINNR